MIRIDLSHVIPTRLPVSTSTSVLLVLRAHCWASQGKPGNYKETLLFRAMTGFASLPLSEHNTSHKRFRGSPRILGPSWSHLPTLTIGLLGVQIFWSVEMGYASPYLLSLGLSKSSLAIVFLAGPLSGLVMQPLIGVLADNSTSRFGRRRPYMLAGTVICIFGMLLLGYTRTVAAVFTGWDNSKVCCWSF